MKYLESSIAQDIGVASHTGAGIEIGSGASFSGFKRSPPAGARIEIVGA